MAATIAPSPSITRSSMRSRSLGLTYVPAKLPTETASASSASVVVGSPARSRASARRTSTKPVVNRSAAIASSGRVAAEGMRRARATAPSASSAITAGTGTRDARYAPTACSSAAVNSSPDWLPNRRITLPPTPPANPAMDPTRDRRAFVATSSVSSRTSAGTNDRFTTV